MRLLFTFLTVIIFSSLAFGQTSEIPDVGATWVEADFGMISMSLPIITEVESDTVIGNHSYKKIGPGYFRDSLNVWYARTEGETTDHLYYDFNVALGDTVYPVNPFLDEIERAPYMVVTIVDSLQLLDGSWKKRIRLYYENEEEGNYSGNVWVEDIGTTRGILRNARMVGIDGGYRGLVCFTDANGQLLFEQPVHEDYGWIEYIYEDCYWTVGISELSDFGISIYPNPADQNIKFDFKNPQKSESLKISIFDLQGREVKSVQIATVGEVEISVDEILTGVYLLKLSGDRLSHTQRLVVRH
jgi:hypothetical protein